MRSGSAEAVTAEALRLAVATGGDEGARLQAASDMVLAFRGDHTPATRAVAARILWKSGRYAEAEALGDLARLAADAADLGLAEAFLFLLPRVRGDADRLELLRQHRRWAEGLERRAADRPIARGARGGGERLRLGFLSADLRQHVVGHFAHPVFEWRDPRFELFAYAPAGARSDVVTPWFASRCAAFRRLPADDRDAAQAIADDGLDALIDLGGPTSANRPAILAWRPAPLQLSWLGYLHPLGLAALDGTISDRFLAPARPELAIEPPRTMPHGAVVMSPAAFQPEPPLAPEPPSARRGFVTFGTANDPYKFNPPMLDAWARVMAAVPGSRLLVVRPEMGAPSLQAAVREALARRGVAADRLEVRLVRGAHRSAYAEIDVALDTFPVTGGATTCEALWMGVPTVSLVGPASFERVSWSVLGNAGLAELGAETVDDYVRIAVALAEGPERLAKLRATMRARILAHPLGQAEAFARDFYDLAARLVAEAGRQAR